LHFSSALDRFGHLPVPSEIFTRRGKKSLRQTTGDVRVTGAGARKNKRGLQAKHLPLPKEEGTKIVFAIRSVNRKPPANGSSPNLDEVLMEDACICSKKK
jgi:hypothetical protein